MDYSREILRPPQCASSQSHHHPSSSTPLLDDHWSSSHQMGDDGDASCFKEKLTDAEAEIRGLKTEVKKLRQCMNGLHVVGRELKKSKEENERLKTISSSTTTCSDGDLRTENNIEDDRRARNENAEHDVRRPSEDDDDAEVADDENDSSSEKNSSDEEEGEEEEEEEEEEERSEDGDNSSEDDDKELGDDLDGLEDSLESDGDDLKDARARTRVKRNDKSKMSSVSANEHQNLSESVHLQEENKELKTSKEAETYHYVTSLEAQELQRKADPTTVNKGETIVGVQSKECCKALEKEIDDLKNTVKEVKGVTHKWDNFWKNKKSEHDTKLKAKDEIIARKDEELSRKDEVLLQKNDEIRVLGEQLESERHEHRTAISLSEHKVEIAHQERETILNEKDTILILTKERVGKLEVTIDELRRELKNEAQKSDRAKKLARNLLKQKNEMEEEIKRLNGTLVEKCEEQSLLKSIDPKSTCYTEPHHSAVMESYHLRPPSPYSPPLSPTKMKMMEKEVLGSEFPAKHAQTTPKEAGKRQKTPAFERQTPPPSPPPQDEERSWTKDELKEQVELFREQTEAYESDFRRERRDREAVAGQLDSVKKELEKTKSKLRVGKPPVHVHRVSDKHVAMKPVRKDPTLHQLPEYYRQQAAPPPQRPGFQNKRDHLIAHGSDRGNKSKQRDEKPRDYRQPRYFEEYKEYEPELFHDDQLEICRCPKHNCYVPVVPLNNLSKQNGAY